MYDLTGIVEHYGKTVRNGHFNFFALAAPYSITKKAWICSDSAKPEEVDEGVVWNKFSRSYFTTWERRQKFATTAAVAKTTADPGSTSELATATIAPTAASKSAATPPPTAAAATAAAATAAATAAAATATATAAAAAAATATAAATSAAAAASDQQPASTRYCCSRVSLRFEQKMIFVFRFGPSLSDFSSKVQR